MELQKRPLSVQLQLQKELNKKAMWKLRRLRYKANLFKVSLLTVEEFQVINIYCLKAEVNLTNMLQK